MRLQPPPARRLGPRARASFFDIYEALDVKRVVGRGERWQGERSSAWDRLGNP